MAEALSAYTRDWHGTRNARRFRQKGLVPGVLYSRGQDAETIAFDLKELSHFLHQGHGLIDLRIEGDKEVRKCILKSVQFNPVTDDVIHIDLLGVRMGEKLTLSVPLHATGTPAGHKHGGILEHILRDLEIECLPSNIPDFLEFDVTALEIGDSLHVSDLSFENIEIVSDPHDTVAQVILPKVAVAAADEEAEEDLEGEEEADQETDDDDEASED